MRQIDRRITDDRLGVERAREASLDSIGRDLAVGSRLGERRRRCIDSTSPREGAVEADLAFDDHRFGQGRIGPFDGHGRSVHGHVTTRWCRRCRIRAGIGPGSQLVAESNEISTRLLVPGLADRGVAAGRPDAAVGSSGDGEPAGLACHVGLERLDPLTARRVVGRDATDPARELAGGIVAVHDQLVGRHVVAPAVAGGVDPVADPLDLLELAATTSAVLRDGPVAAGVVHQFHVEIGGLAENEQAVLLAGDEHRAVLGGHDVIEAVVVRAADAGVERDGRT